MFFLHRFFLNLLINKKLTAIFTRSPGMKGSTHEIIATPIPAPVMNMNHKIPNKYQATWPASIPPMFCKLLALCMNVPVMKAAAMYPRRKPPVGPANTPTPA